MAAKAEDAPALPTATTLDSLDPVSEPMERLPRKRHEEGEMPSAEGEEALPCESKRRRTCPAALETMPSSSPGKGEAGDYGSNGSVPGEFPFSFDTRGFVSPVETTPKFGCFCFPVADLVIAEAEPTRSEVEAESAREAGGSAEEDHGVDDNRDED